MCVIKSMNETCIIFNVVATTFANVFFIARRTENGVTTKEVHGKVLTYKHIFSNAEKIPAAPPCLPEKTRAGLNLPSINIYGL